MRSDFICFKEMDGWKLITLFDIQILSGWHTQCAHIICLCNRLLFYSKRTIAFDVCFIYSDISLKLNQSEPILVRWAYCAWMQCKRTAGNTNKFLSVGLITTAFRCFSAFSFFSFRFGRASAYSISHFGHSQVSQIREISDSFVNRWTLMQGSLNEWDIHKDVL